MGRFQLELHRRGGRHLPVAAASTVAANIATKPSSSDAALSDHTAAAA